MNHDSLDCQINLLLFQKSFKILWHYRHSIFFVLSFSFKYVPITILKVRSISLCRFKNKLTYVSLLCLIKQTLLHKNVLFKISASNLLQLNQNWISLDVFTLIVSAEPEQEQQAWESSWDWSCLHYYRQIKKDKCIQILKYDVDRYIKYLWYFYLSFLFQTFDKTVQYLSNAQVLNSNQTAE